MCSSPSPSPADLSRPIDPPCGKAGYRDLPIVAVVGRPNVGKSTLFNRMVRGRIAIVDNQPGITRDRNYKETHWAGKRFFVVDTGGLVPGSTDAIETLVRQQVEAALEEASLLVFVVDAAAGVTALDKDIAELVRKIRKPYVLAVNKVDSERAQAQTTEFYELGLGDFVAISAEHGRNVGDLLDVITAHIPAAEPEEGHVTAIAVVGKPNVGKSSLVNRLTGTSTVIVDERPGTTRDAVDTYVDTRYGTIKLVDTAGLRRRSKADTNLEKHANLRSVGAIDRSEVTILMVDSDSGLTRQDLTIASYVEQSGKAMILAWNKWDLHADSDRETFLERVRARFRHQPYLPVVFMSCLTGEGLEQLVDVCFQVYASWDARIPTGILNRGLKPHIERKPPRTRGRRAPRVYYAAQTGTRPPTFTLFVNDPGLISDNYRKFIEKKIRGLFAFQGSPLRIRVRKSK